MELPQDAVLKILEKNEESLLKRAGDTIVKEWNKFKVDSNLAFRQYLSNSYEKYSKIKTVLYRIEPKYIYDFFEYPTLRKDMVQISSHDVNNILGISHFVIIKGTGGVGKSTFMKHLFLNELSKKDLIPIFIELKNLNGASEVYDIKKFIFEQLTYLGVSFDFKYLDYALESGCFLFLLDGYDEIVTQKKNDFFQKITNFCDQFPNNYFILSSRPYGTFVEFQRFTVLNLCKFSKEQAISMVNKLDYDAEVKVRFVRELETTLYKRHTSFASNPLLLTIMLMTYDNFAEIPEKLHIFYANAFETLYSKHDATKGGYKRELKSKLDCDAFRKIFSYFCFMTYFKGETRFSYDDLFELFTKIRSIIKVSFVIEDYIDDLINAICLLYKEGLSYQFTHRSFQEYFTAIFLRGLSDDNMKKTGIALIQNDEQRVANDAVFDMLYDMCEEKVEQNILLPILEDVEEGYTGTDKYDFYYQKFPFIFNICSDFPSCEGEYALVKTVDLDYQLDNQYENILDKFSLIKRNESLRTGNPLTSDDQALIRYFLENSRENVDVDLPSSNFSTGDIEYELLKKSWIGIRISILANLRDELIQKKRDTDSCLDALFN